MTEQLPPYNLDAEQAVLGSCLIDSEVVRLLDLGAEDFFTEQNQFIFQAIKKCGEGANQITVAHELNRMGKLYEAGGASYLSCLVSMTPTPRGVLHYARVVQELAFHRRLISAAGQIEAVGYKAGDPTESIDKVHKIVKGLSLPVKDDSVLTPDDVAGDAWAHYNDQTSASYTPTGIQSLDQKIGGYLQGEYSLLCARTGVGKTTIALQQACHIAQTKPDIFFSLEMNKQQVTNKNIARMTGIPEQVISLKRYDASQRELILAAVVELSKLKLYVAEGNQTIESIRRKIDKQLDTVGCEVVFIDYLHRISDRVGKDEHLRISHISKELAGMAKEYQIPFIVVHQLNRDIEYRKGEAKKPQLSDLREGGEEDADLILMPMRDPDNAYRVEIHKPKDRLRGNLGYIEVNYFQGIYS